MVQDTAREWQLLKMAGKKGDVQALRILEQQLEAYGDVFTSFMSTGYPP